jgi:transposase
MQVVYQQCAGLDVHKQTVVACLLITQGNGRVQEQVRTFGTMTADLAALSQWLEESQVEQVALESTGVFTPPTMLQSVGVSPEAGERAVRPTRNTMRICC